MSNLVFPIGMSGKKVVTANLEAMPHMLVGGTTGSGKSSFLHTMIYKLIGSLTPDQVRFVLVDPKRVEFHGYKGMPHLASPVVSDISETMEILNYVVKEMNTRYEFFATKKVKDIGELRKNSGALTSIVVVVDELSDLIMQDPAVETALIRLAQTGRGAGIYLVVATQNPVSEVVTSLLKANFPARVALRVSSATNSRVILDSKGAERLKGKGDLLFKSPEKSETQRIQGLYTPADKIKNLVDFWKSETSTNYFFGAKHPEMEEKTDEFLGQAVKLAEKEEVSTSILQKKFSIDYVRAVMLLDALKERGLVKDGRN